jgi:hypothetical protein
MKILIRIGGGWESVGAKVYDDEDEFHYLLKNSRRSYPATRIGRLDRWSGAASSGPSRGQSTDSGSARMAR